MACALHLDKLGFRIFGGVRKERDGESLIHKSAGRITPLLIDVTNKPPLLLQLPMWLRCLNIRDLSVWLIMQASE
jgi:hypothetical protein